MLYRTYLTSIRNRLARIFHCGVLVGIGLGLLPAIEPLAQEQPTSESALQALYLYNFAKFVVWPDKVFANQQSPITLCIYGEKPSEIRQAIVLIDGKTAQGREVKSRRSVSL